ncbi:hypothetical protein IIY59_02115, partial [Candidatus Saccharibacteria bacterium]|nr:hypothetical protein [Candidatus Saccharibacteria bacterium]
ERIREKKRENFIRKRYAGEDHGSFYDEANTIASEEDQRRYEEWLRRHEPEEPDDSENVPESPDDPGDSPDNPDDPGDSPDNPDNPDNPGDNPDDPEGGPEDPETPGDDPDNPEDPGDSQDDDLDNKLIASRTNREKEGEAYVEHVAEVALNADAEGKRKGLLKGLRKTLKGTVFRSFYKQRYSELVDLKLRSDQGLELGDDEKRKLERAKGSRMWKAMETAMSTADFGDGKVVNERLGKGGAGESAADKVNVREKFGEKAERMDDALTAETRSIMESYISGDMMEKYRNGELDLEEGLSEKEVLDRQFDGLRAKLQGEGGDGGDILAVDNFVEIAEKAKANAEKLESQIEDFSERMDRVFDGFALVSAESRGVTRSEQHKTNLDKIMSRVESSTVGKFIPPAAVAAIGGAGIYLGQRIATGAATAVAPVVGGAAVGGVFSGLKEGNRVSRDRATRGTTMEMGLAGGERRADREIESTMYETYSVSDMMDAMQTAKAKYEESGSDEDRVAWLNEVKKAVVVQDYADENRVGLLAYDSNSEKSLAEQQAEFFGEISQAMATLSPEEQNGFMRATEAEDDVIRQTKEAIEGDRSAKDDVFRRVKRRRMVSTGVKTFAISAAAGFAIQEVAALVNPNQVGVLESRFGIGRQNSATASDTSLNRLLFDRTGRQNVGDKIPESQMDQYRGSDRFIVKKNPDTYHEESRTITETLKGHDKIDVWGNNRTVPYDQNELHLKYDSSEGVPFFDGRGVVTSSETGNTLNLGKSDIDFLIVGSNGRTLRVDTVVDGSGHIVPKDPKVFDGWFDSRGNFLGDRLHVVSDVDGDTWSVATVLGEGSKDSVTRTIVEKVKDPATYAVERIVDVAPAIPFGESRRRNLSTPSRPERPVGGGENPPSAPEEPSDSGNGGGETSDQAIPDSPEETPDNNGENVSDETGSNSNGGDGPQIITETDPNTGDETTTIIDTTGPTTAGGTGGSARTAMDVATGVAGMAAAGVGGAVQGAARAMRAPVNAASNSTRRIVANPIRQNAEPQPVSTGEDSDAYYERVTREQNARDERIREEAEQNRRRREAEEQQARDEAERNRRLREEEEQRIRQEAIAAQQAQQTQRAQQVQ